MCILGKSTMGGTKNKVRSLLNRILWWEIKQRNNVILHLRISKWNVATQQETKNISRSQAQIFFNKIKLLGCYKLTCRALRRLLFSSRHTCAQICVYIREPAILYLSIYVSSQSAVSPFWNSTAHLHFASDIWGSPGALLQRYSLFKAHEPEWWWELRGRTVNA